MEWMAELHVPTYSTHTGDSFVCPQFSLQLEKRKECPDFVVLDFSAKEIKVVEVTTAWDIHSLAERLEFLHRQSEEIKKQIMAKSRGALLG